VSSALKIGIAAGLVAALAVMIYLSVAGNRVSCQVCVEFGGRTECRRASAESVEEAQAAAANTACYLLTGGIADGLACRNTQPKSIECRDR
jgi:hypothetical protein